MSLRVTNVKDKIKSDLKTRTYIQFKDHFHPTQNRCYPTFTIIKNAEFKVYAFLFKATEINPKIPQDLGLCRSDMHASGM